MTVHYINAEGAITIYLYRFGSWMHIYIYADNALSPYCTVRYIDVEGAIDKVLMLTSSTALMAASLNSPKACTKPDE